MKIIRKMLFLAICIAGSNHTYASVSDSVTDTKKVVDFNILKIHGNFNVVITQGKTCSLRVVAADKDAIAAVDVKASPTLNITMKEGTKSSATLYITVKEDIRQITINTVGNVSSTNSIKAENFALNIDGDVNVNISVDITLFTYTSSSSKPIVIKGKAKTCNFNDSGEGSVDASGLKIDNLNLDDSSDGELKVYAKPEMHVKLSGTGALIYYGSPRVKTFKLAGQADEKQITESK